MDTNRITASLFGLGLVIFGTPHAVLVSLIGLAILAFMANPKLGRTRASDAPLDAPSPEPAGGSGTWT